MKDCLQVKKSKFSLPIFLPDATLGVTRSVDSLDLRKARVNGVVVNTYHLMSDPGISVLKKLDGIKGFMNFPGLVVSDSGGWQVFSLIHRRKNAGKITDKGVTFSLGKAKRTLFTPEKSLQVQFNIGSDIAICLDDFTPPDAKEEKILESVERTLLWAKRTKLEYQRIIKERKLNEEECPLLFAVIQGGFNKKMRAYCMQELLKIGFDGYGFGGYMINDDGNLDLSMAKFIVDLIPNQFHKFALGFGKPYEIANLYQMGWDFFDCTLPTRDGRHKRLYVFKKDLKTLAELEDRENYDFLHIHREKYRRDERPISEFCDCHTCKNFSRSYLHHLFNIGDTLAFRLATIHNIRTYTLAIEKLKVLSSQRKLFEIKK